MKKILALSILVVLVIASCKKDEDSTPPTTTPATYDDTPYELYIGSFPAPEIPTDNELTEQKVQLGRMLFYEPRLSALDNQSCASCHAQATAFSDTALFSVGTFGDLGDRQAMSAFNLAWNTDGFFWDGRSPTLRHQSLQPIENPVEMAETHANVIAKLSQDQTYLDQFIRAFGDDEITADRMGLAMEQFMMTIVSNDSKYDRVQAGSESFTESEQRGHDLFFAEYNPFFPDISGADCAHCHSGVNFENDQYMNNGLDSDADFTDLGRYNVTEDDMDKAKFKVTTLRNIELTPPYMHDGRFQTLEEVLDHYNEGVQLSSTVDPTIANTEETGLLLTDDDKADLINFMKTLTDETLINNPEYSDPF
ncbi:MAG: cytochrome-c peroxidase [Flavobacteriales bacterium]|nr:cytochrome-c peroxidase [Flavobacteriales bacterium]